MPLKRKRTVFREWSPKVDWQIGSKDSPCKYLSTILKIPDRKKGILEGGFSFENSLHKMCILWYAYQSIDTIEIARRLIVLHVCLNLSKIACKYSITGYSNYRCREKRDWHSAGTPATRLDHLALPPKLPIWTHLVLDAIGIICRCPESTSPFWMEVEQAKGRRSLPCRPNLYLGGVEDKNEKLVADDIEKSKWLSRILNNCYNTVGFNFHSIGEATNKISTETNCLQVQRL